MPKIRIATAAALVFLLVACGSRGPRHFLGDYDFTTGSVAVPPFTAPTPDLVVGDFRAQRNPIAAAVQTGARAAIELEGRRARSRLDTASTNIDLSARIAERTLEQSARYLRSRPVQDPAGADYHLELDIGSISIDAQGSQAVLVVSAYASLVDAATDREIWRAYVNDRGPITADGNIHRTIPTQLVTAANLRSVTTEDFEALLDRSAQMVADWISGRLREDLRSVRR